MLLKWHRQLKLLLFTKALEKEEVPEVVEVTEEVADKIEGVSRSTLHRTLGGKPPGTPTYLLSEPANVTGNSEKAVSYA